MAHETSAAGTRGGNRDAVLEVLHRSGPLSRADLIRLTGLSRSTVSAIVRELIDARLVQECAGTTKAGAGSPGPAGAPERRSGRPPTLLAVTGAPGVLVGVDVGHRHVRVAVATPSAVPLTEEFRSVDVDHDAGSVLALTAELVERGLAKAEVIPDRVLGVGLGVPGPIDPRTGTIVSPILPGWVGLAPAAELSRRIGLEVRADNDANLGALGELQYGAARGVDDVIYVKVAGGIGAGLVLAGRLHRGVTGIAGEIGHVRLQDEGPVCRCGSRGCLETMVAAQNLVGLLQPAYAERLTVERMLELAREGDAGVNRILDDAGRSIGRVLADLSNHLNPAAIVVGGDVGSSESLLRGISDSVQRYAQPDTAAALRVIPGELGERAELMGALALAQGATAAAGHHEG
jgi:predicted NBD/HSP70 family sugar kinase